jgi:type 2 lantibiotic biosynthesis protein LanM
MVHPILLSNHERFIAQARKVGDRLTEMARQRMDSVSWSGFSLIHERAWSVRLLGTNLYDGLPGVILFLAYLSSITGEEEYNRLARGALVTLRRQIGETSKIASVGGYSGVSGVIYLLCHLSVLWNERELLEEAETLANRLPEAVDRDERLDIVSGTAGCLVVLLTLHRLLASDRILPLAVRCGDHLLAKAIPMRPGVGWPVKGLSETPLTGFSHGAAGIAWALMELAALTEEERFFHTAMEATAWERSLFLHEAGNWPDLRYELPPDSDPKLRRCSLMWCHGAPGIGLARLNMLKHFDNSDLRMEIETALQTTLREGFGFSHCLCHGDLGNLELILKASLELNEPSWPMELNTLSATILESIERDGWRCGTPSNIESPGLMTGLAGIGYQLLRLAKPARVPSVLSLAPPVVSRNAVRRRFFHAAG